jgi:hypothetical protein
MAMVMIGSAKRSASRATSQSIMRKVDTGLRLYKTDFRAYPYQLGYPATDAGPWDNTLYYHLGTDISDADADAIHADMDAAAANYSYNCTNPNPSRFAIRCADSTNALNPWNDFWENPTGNPHQFLRAGTWDKKVGSAAVLNRMAAERARLIMLVGGVDVGGVHRPAIPSGPYAQPEKDLSGIPLVASPQSASGGHKPGWAHDYLQGELDARFIRGDAVLDAHFRPLIYVCQVVMGVRSTETMLFHQAEFCEHPEFFGLATIGRKTLSHTADPDPAGGLPDPADLMASDITTYAAPGREIEFELWSAGPDGRFARMRNDPANVDNVPCEKYNKDLDR